MLTLNLSSLGITEEALTKAVLRELNLTPEQAVKQIAERLGVTLPAAGGITVRNGDEVGTALGVAEARLVSEADYATLVAARDVLERIL